MNSKIINIKNKFINFFIKKNHLNKSNNNIIPTKNSTLLFINAGMVPFKHLFLDNTKTTPKNIVTIQQCIRMGGKQSDLENVGKTKYHHTFFEMLGNFSFGNYFKKEAITYAWEFLTKILKISESNLFVTVHEDDTEAFTLWNTTVNLEKKKILKTTTNFWEMGTTGPCGYCSEIFYTYNTKTYAVKNAIEIWNIVFIEYSKNENNEVQKLSKKSIDTGLGFERITMILQKKKTTYETSIFKETLKKIKKLTKTKVNYNKIASYILVDHLRCCIILINKNIHPTGKDSRGSILKKLLKRILEQSEKLFTTTNTVLQLINPCIKDLKKNNIKIQIKKEIIENIIKKEQFLYEKINKIVTKLFKKETKNTNILTGDQIFNLYETYGIKLDKIKNLAQKENIILNIKEFHQKFQKEKIKNKKLTECKNRIITDLATYKTNFVHTKKSNIQIKILYIVQKNKKRITLSNKKKDAQLILNKTTYYPTKKEYFNTIGIIKTKKFQFSIKKVVQYLSVYIHYGILTKGKITVNDLATLTITKKHHKNIQINHTALHILISALKIILNTEINEKNATITHKKLQIIFNCKKDITQKDIYNIENYINEIIRQNLTITTRQKLQNKNTHLILDAYFSQEPCTNTYVKKTSEIMTFKVIALKKMKNNLWDILAVTQ